MPYINLAEPKWRSDGVLFARDSNGARPTSTWVKETHICLDYMRYFAAIEVRRRIRELRREQVDFGPAATMDALNWVLFHRQTNEGWTTTTRRRRSAWGCCRVMLRALYRTRLSNDCAAGSDRARAGVQACATISNSARALRSRAFSSSSCLIVRSCGSVSAPY